MRKHRHIGIYGVITQNNKILLVKKSRGAYKGKLDLPGGKPEHGERILDCLKREISEETGLDLQSAEIYDTLSYSTKWSDDGELEDLYHIGIIYKADIYDFKRLSSSGDGLDSLGACWVELRTVDKNNLSPFANKIVSDLLCVEK